MGGGRKGEAPLTMTTRWWDAKGREWRIVVKLPFGRNVCTTTDRRFQGDWSHKEIRAAIACAPAVTDAPADP